LPAAIVKSTIEQELDAQLAALRTDLVRTVCELVCIPSENLPPHGHEAACQSFVAAALRELEIEPDIYEPSEVASLAAHPHYWPGRCYSGRPNVNGVLKGSGGGRSLLLSGHIDTVPLDTPVAWTRDPLGDGEQNGRIYGRGSWDMKAGVAMNLTVLRALRRMGARLAGDLVFETVVDEEFGGSNGTLAGRLRGYNCEAAVITEPTSLRICPAQRGGRIVHIVLHGSGGILQPGAPQGRAVDQLAYVLSRLPEFAQNRAAGVTVDPYYANCSEPFAVWITNIATGKWGWTQPITIPEQCRIEMYWQTMPEEDEEASMRAFREWWKAVVAGCPSLCARTPEVTLPMRWIPGSSIPRASALVTEFSASAAAAGIDAAVEGLDAPSDMFVIQKCFETPALMWGPDGAGAHQADEYVDVESLYAATRVLLRFVARWCGLTVRP
jgi:acetylornithine deacetylase